MSKKQQVPIKPTTKESYAMPKTQTSNRFEVLGQLSKAKSSNPLKPVYLTKETKLMLQVLEADHISASGSILTEKIFQNYKFFISNEVLKTRKFYEFILVDTESVQISHISNPEGTDTAYSKCKIQKVLNEKDWDQNIFTHKKFSQNFDPQTFDYYDYKNAWFHAFCVRPSTHSWFFNWDEKIQKSFPNWFQEWWLLMGATSEIFCPEIKKSYEFYKSNSDSFFPSGNSYSLLFCAQFRIPWILCWDFCSHHFQPSPFPKYLAREFKIKWWAAFKLSQAQTFEAVKNWVEAQKPTAKMSLASKSKVPIWSQPLPGPITKTSFPSNSAYRAYLKGLQAQAAETLSQLAGSDSEDEEETASSSAFLQQNEDMCFGFPFTPLE